MSLRQPVSLSRVRVQDEAKEQPEQQPAVEVRQYCGSVAAAARLTYADAAGEGAGAAGGGG